MKPKLNHGPTARRWGLATQTLPLFALVLLPKCPLCLAVYLGFFTLLGVGTLTASKWATRLVLLAAGLVVAKLLRTGIRCGTLVPFWLGLAGFVAVLASRSVLDSITVRCLGLVLLLLAFRLIPQSTTRLQNL